jgi:hypothetical protein
LSQLGFQFDSEAENCNANFHSSFKDLDPTQTDQESKLIRIQNQNTDMTTI